MHLLTQCTKSSTNCYTCSYQFLLSHFHKKNGHMDFLVWENEEDSRHLSAVTSMTLNVHTVNGTLLVLDSQYNIQHQYIFTVMEINAEWCILTLYPSKYNKNSSCMNIALPFVSYHLVCKCSFIYHTQQLCSVSGILFYTFHITTSILSEHEQSLEPFFIFIFLNNSETSVSVQ